jgi:hypothetical protein
MPYFQTHIFETPITQNSYSAIASEDFGFVEDKIPDEDWDKIQKYWQSIVKIKFPNFYPENFDDVFSWPLANLRAFSYNNSRLQEFFDKTIYPSFVAKHNSDLRPRDAGLSDFSKDMIFPRAVSSVTETKDGKIIMGYRGHNVLAPNKETPLPQGMMRVSDTKPTSIFLTILDRLKGELGISSDSVEKLEMLSICGHSDYPDISSGFHMKLSLTSKEVEEISKAKISEGFNSGLHYVEKADLKDFVKRYRNTTGDSVASALAFLDHEFGRNCTGPLVESLEGKMQGKIVYDSLQELCGDLEIKFYPNLL